MLGRNFKEIMSKQVKLGKLLSKICGVPIPVTATFKLFHSDAGKGLVSTILLEWDKKTDPEKIRSFINYAIDIARKGAGAKTHEFHNDFSIFLSFEDIHNTNIPIKDEEKFEDTALQYGYLEFEKQYLLEEKKVRMFINSKPYFEAAVNYLTEEDIQGIKDEYLKTMKSFS